MAVQDPRIFSVNGNRLAERGVRDSGRIAVLERGGGVVGGLVTGAGALHSGDAITGDVEGNLLGPITINPDANPTMTGLILNNATANPTIQYMTATAGERATFQYRDGLTPQWQHLKETNNAFRLMRTSQTAGNGQVGTDVNGAQGPINMALEVGPGSPAADIYLWNKVKIWATPNTVYGNTALDVSAAKMSGGAIGAVTGTNQYRIACGVSQFVSGSNGTRDGVANNNAINIDIACGANANFFDPFLAVSTITGTDLGSIQNYASYITVDEPATTDAYVEGYSFPTAVYNYRRGSLVSGGEVGLHLFGASQTTVGHDGRSTSTKAGPARGSGFSVILNENNAWSTYDSATIFGTNSAWRTTGARGFWVHNSSPNTTYGERVGTGIWIGGYYAGFNSDDREFERALVVNIGSSPSTTAGGGSQGTDVFTLDGLGNAGFNVPVNHTDNTTGLPARAVFPNSIAQTDGLQFGYTSAAAPTTVFSRLYRSNTAGRMTWRSSAGPQEMEIRAVAGQNTRIIFSDAGTGRFHLSKEGSDLTFVLARTASVTMASGVLRNVFTASADGTGAAADVVFSNSVKIVATPNATFGNSALDCSMSAWNATYNSVSQSRISVGVTGGFTNGTNGTRTGTNAITSDSATASDGTFYFPYQFSATVGITDLGSINGYLSQMSVTEPSADAYVEVYGGVSLITNRRRGALVSGWEYHIDNNAPTSGLAGPARISGFSVVFAEHNTYASYNSATIFGTTSAWQESGSRGGWIHNSGSQRGGTGLWIGGYHADATSDTAEWQRAIVVNVGSAVGVKGVDVFTVDGKGSCAVRIPSNQATNTTGFDAAFTCGFNNGSPSNSTGDGIRVAEAYIHRGSANVLKIAGASLFPSGGIVSATTGATPTTGYIPTGGLWPGALSGTTSGRNTNAVAGSLYFIQIDIPRNQTFTGVGVLCGATGGSDSWIVALYDSTGALLRSSALAGTTVGGIVNGWQEIPFTSAYSAAGPARYYIVLQSNGTTVTFRTWQQSSFPAKTLTGSTTGTFGTLPSITVPTTYTTDVGPVAYLYG